METFIDKDTCWFNVYFLAIIIYRTFLEIEVHSPDEW